MKMNIAGTLTVEAKNIAGGFVAQPKGSLTVTNSSINNASISSDTDKAGGLAGYTESYVTISETHITGDLTVKGQNIAGGFVAQPKGFLTVTNSSINNASISSDTDKAGGLVGYTENDVTISETDIKEKLTVQGKNQVGGFVGQLAGNATIQKSHILNATIISNEADAGGLIGESSGDNVAVSIGSKDTKTVITNIIVTGNKATGGLLGKATGNAIDIKNVDIKNAAIISNGDVGGIAGYTSHASTTIESVEVVGKNTSIISKTVSSGYSDGQDGNAGGLIGTLKVSQNLSIDNSAVSAFVTSPSKNAGGIIGLLNQSKPDYDDTKKADITRSYYGGRTVNGAYDTNAYNITGATSAGGFIGYIENANNLNIKQCFSTGSVKAVQNIGGFLGYTKGSVNISNCYSMGRVPGSNSTSVGGFVGYLDSSIKFENTYFLNAYSAIKYALHNDPSDTRVTVLTKPDATILSADSSDMTTEQFTTTYDSPLLDGQSYPYKNWTRDGDNDTDPIAYYGDWPQQLNGKFVFYHSVDGNPENGGMFTLTGYGTIFSSNILKQKEGITLGEAGFGIVCEKPDRGTAKSLYGWSFTKDGIYQDMKLDGNNSDPKCSIVNVGSKQYYFFRITMDEFEGIAKEQYQNNSIYIKDKVGTKYEITVKDGKATFKLLY